MGDLRILRHAIFHAKSNIRPEEHKRLKVIGAMFPSSTPIHISYDNMHKLFVLIKKGLRSPNVFMAWHQG